MRKSYFAIIALGALVIASCQKENSADLPKVDSPVFTATLDTGSDTKTELVERDGKKKSEWVSGDAIRVLNGTNIKGCDAVYTTTDEGASATFKTDVKSFKGDAFIAMYPATPAGSAWWNAAADKTVNKLKLKPEQKAVASGYDPEAHIAVAYSETTSLEFKNAVSLLKFTVASDNVTEVCVYANDAANAAGGENVLSGHFSFNTETKKVTTPTGDGISINNYVKVKGTFVKGNTYYIACLPTTFTKGFTVEVVSNGIKGQDKKTEKPYTLGRNKILDLGTVEYVATVETRTLYLETGVWNTDSPKYDAWSWGGETSGTWVDFEQASEDGKYFKVTIPKGITGISVFRRSSSHTSHCFENDEGNRWNYVKDVAIDDTINSIVITGWINNSSLSTYKTSKDIPTF